MVYFVFEGNFPSTSIRGAYIWRGDLAEGFLRYRFGGLIHGGAYFRNFTVSQRGKNHQKTEKEKNLQSLKLWLNLPGYEVTPSQTPMCEFRSLTMIILKAFFSALNAV